MHTPAEQRRPSLLLAAVNFLLASHPDAALAAYYPVHGGRQPVDSQLMAAFATFCAEYAEKLGELLRNASTQTNEIRRCVILRLALSHVSRRWPGPLAWPRSARARASTCSSTTTAAASETRRTPLCPDHWS